MSRYQPRHGGGAPTGSPLELVGLIGCLGLAVLIITVQSLSPTAYTISCGWSPADCDRSREGISLLIFFGTPVIALLGSLLAAVRSWTAGRRYFYWPLVGLLVTEAIYLLAAVLLNLG